jgi:hypothetical protein
MSVFVLTRIKAKAGCERQLQRAIQAMIAKQAHQNDAGPQYTLYRSAEDPALLMLWERHDGDSIPDSDNDAGGLIEELAGLIDGRPILEMLVEVADE